MNDFLNLLRIESEEIHNRFEKASIEGKTTSQEVSDRREETVKSFLEKYFPFPHRIVKGNIIDTFGRRSDSIDCIVLSPAHPYTIDNISKKASVIFADGVDYVIEVKGRLDNTDELRRGLKQLRSVKQLQRVRDTLLFPKKFSEGYKLWVKRIPTVIFADDTFATPEKLVYEIAKYYLEEHVHPIEQFDLMVINKKLIVLNVSEFSCYQNYPRGIYWKETGENTLAEFLLRLNLIPPAEPPVSESIIPLYLKDLNSCAFKTSAEINKKLTMNKI